MDVSVLPIVNKVTLVKKLNWSVYVKFGTGVSSNCVLQLNIIIDLLQVLVYRRRVHL